MAFFNEQFREELLNHLIDKAKSDARISSCALVGSYSINKHDTWSDIDLSFGIQKSEMLEEVKKDYTNHLMQRHACVKLFDVLRSDTTYRVFLLENGLQVDLSFSQQNNFGSVANTFKLVFGEAKEKQPNPKPALEEVFGYFVHHALRARVSNERGKKWQALFWINEARNYIFKMYCLEHNLNPDYAREFDLIEDSFLKIFENAVPKNISKTELHRCLTHLCEHVDLISSKTKTLKKQCEKQLQTIMS